MKIKREQGNDASIEEIANGYIVRYSTIEVEDDDYNYRTSCQHFDGVDGALAAIKSFYDLQVYIR